MADVSIRFGAISPPIASQLKIQKIKVDKDTTDRWQQSADAIKILELRDVITETEASRARKRLFNIIVKHLNKNG